MNRDGSAATLDAPNLDPLKGTKYDFPRDSVGYGKKSLNPQWPNGAKIAISFVINYEEVSFPCAAGRDANHGGRDPRGQFRMGILSLKPGFGNNQTSQLKKESVR